MDTWIYLEEIVIQCNVSRSRWSTSNECFQIYALSDVEGNFNRSREILNAWSPDNRGSNIPILSKNDNNGNFSTASDWYLEDASYLRLKNVTLSYDLSDVFCKWSHLNDRNSRLSVF